MSRLPLSHLSWLMPGVRLLKARNERITSHLERVGIAPRLVEEGSGWITKNQLYRFYDEVARGKGGTDFGFAVGTGIAASQLGPLGAAMAEAASFGEALDVFCRLTPLHVESVSLWVEKDEADGSLAWLCTRTHDWIPGLSDVAEHVALAAMVSVIKIVGGPNWRPRRARLQAAPCPDAERHPMLSDCEIQHFQTSKAVVFPRKFLVQSVPQREIPGTCDASDLLPKDDHRISSRIELLGASIQEAGMPLPSATEFAALAGFSPRTLHRLLGAEGSSLRGVCDRIRLKRARWLLESTELSVKEVAFEVGYSGSNNFIRAFRRLTGMTPEVSRRQAGGHC